MSYYDDEKAKKAASSFFMGVGRVHIPREEWSDFLFPLALIMDAQGELAEDARHLVTDETGPQDER